MKRFFLYFFSALLAFVATSGMFIVKYHVMSKEAELSRLHRQIMRNNRSIHILKAEWTNLSDPKRLRILVEKNTNLKIIKASQIIEWKDVVIKEPLEKGGA